MRRFTLACIAFAGSACTQLVTEALPPQTVDETFQGSVQEWSTGDQVTLAVKLFDSDGKLGICGTWAETPGGGLTEAAFNERLIQTLSLKGGSETVANDISFFKKGRYTRDRLPSGDAACRKTDIPWSVKFAGNASFEAARSNFVIYD